MHDADNDSGFSLVRCRMGAEDRVRVVVCSLEQAFNCHGFAAEECRTVGAENWLRIYSSPRRRRGSCPIRRIGGRPSRRLGV
jgi:hypothetical protein